MFDHRMSATPNRRLRQPQRLPSGRHGLPRSFVVSNQRERILDAVADVASLAGYAAMTVEDIIATAGRERRAEPGTWSGGTSPGSPWRPPHADGALRKRHE
jgi:AcrR family transcriptional regulator